MMRHEIDHTELMQYIDGELTTQESARIEAHLATCTECSREVAIFGAMKAELRGLTSDAPPAPSVWNGVRRRVVRPLGWLFLVGGVVAWLAMALHAFLTAPGAFWEKLAAGSIWIGLLLLLLMVGMERYQDWKTDPYREIER
jgi:anti-sigma factor RsiW